MNRDSTIFRLQKALSIRYLLSLFFFLVITNYLLKNICLEPYAEYLWNIRQTDIFINSSQEERAFLELQRYEDKIRFEMLIGESPQLTTQAFNSKIQKKSIQLAQIYNQESIDSIANVFADLFSVLTISTFLIFGKKEIFIIKSFINSFIYGLTDATKSFFIILFTDIFVGFHSSHGWEILIEMFLKHLGLPENKDFIFFLLPLFLLF